MKVCSELKFQNALISWEEKDSFSFSREKLRSGIKAQVFLVFPWLKLVMMSNENFRLLLGRILSVRQR